MASTLNSVVGALRANLSLNSAQFTNGMKSAQSSLKRFGSQMSIASAAIGAGAAAALTAFNTSANRMSDLQANARIAGITAQEMQTLAMASAQFGVTQEQLSDQLKDVNDKFGDYAATGAGPLADFFDNIAPKVGLTIKSFEGLSSSEAIALYVKALEDANLTQAETTFYMEALANDGTKLIDVFGNGGKAIDDMRKRMKEYGITVDEATIQKSKEAKVEMTLMGEAFRSVWDQAVLEFAPAIKEAFIALQPAIANVTQGIAAMGRSIAAAATWFGGLNPKIQSAVGGFLVFATVLGPIVLGLSGMISLAGPLVAGLGAVGVAIKAVSMALLANPIGLAVAAIAGAAYLIYQNWETVGPWFSKLWENVKTIFNGFKDFIVGIFTLDADLAVEGLKGIWSGLSGYFQTIWDGISGIFTFAWENAIKPILDKLGVTEYITAAWQSFRSTIGSVMDGIGAAFNAAYSFIKPVIDALKWVLDKGSAAISKIRGGREELSRSEIDELAGYSNGKFTSYETDILNGTQNGTSGAYGAGQNTGQEFLGGVKDSLDINSPSKEMEKIGQFSIQGLVKGLEGSEGSNIQSSAESITDSIKSSFTSLFTDVLTGARSFNDVLSEMLQNIANQLLQIAADSLWNGTGLGASVGNAVSSLIPGFAKGTNGSGAGLAMVGEQGPELMHLSAGTKIRSNSETNKMLNNMNQNSTSAVHISLSEGLEANILKKAENQSVQISTAANERMRKSLPGEMRRISADSRRS